MNDQNPQEQFQRHVVDLVETNFKATGRGLLLAQLGHDLRVRGVDLPAVLAGQKLSEALREKLSDHVTLFPDPSDPKVIFAIPRTVPVESVSFEPKSAPERDTDKLPRVAPPIWAAFIKPLSPGMKRVVQLEPFGFRDVDESVVVSGQPVITNEYLQPRQASTLRTDHAHHVFENLTRWIAENDIALDSVKADSGLRRPDLQRSSVFHQVVAALSEEQRRRTSLPLDVVATLLRA